MVLFGHVLTHMLVSASLVILILDRNSNTSTIRRRLFFIISGSIAGVLPDILGPGTVYTWSHSIFLSPILVIPLVLVSRIVYKDKSLIRVWLSFTTALIIGHLLVDYLGHEVALFFPLSKMEISASILLLGDPWIWLPLAVGVLIVFISPKRLLVLYTVLIIVFVYTGLRVCSKVNTEALIKSLYPDQSSTQYVVIPRTSNLIEELNPLDWLSWSFEVIGEYRVITGSVPLFGGSANTNFNVIFPHVGIITNVNNIVYRKGSSNTEQYFSVNYETYYNQQHYILANDSTHELVFALLDDKWIEVNGQLKETLITYMSMKLIDKR
ncbi:metal-dependent hydrolase [Paenibacillus alba]|uniref:metal-dependent hydrolase n=1 Tax=Paenibacillus alba TaxID=1197127 RepID=UPI001565AD63|nr:metal-dependent hydrolase [Paenibacillus alba]NQX69769.1 metal-dependent hydrolase [Paenibacillus alba]